MHAHLLIPLRLKGRSLLEFSAKYLHQRTEATTAAANNQDSRQALQCSCTVGLCALRKTGQLQIHGSHNGSLAQKNQSGKVINSHYSFCLSPYECEGTFPVPGAKKHTASIYCSLNELALSKQQPSQLTLLWVQVLELWGSRHWLGEIKPLPDLPLTQFNWCMLSWWAQEVAVPTYPFLSS